VSYADAFLSKDSLDRTIVKDLSDEWMVFDKKYNSYIPYLDSSRQTYTISRKLDLEKYKDYNLNFTADPGLGLFINNKLYYTNSTGRINFVRFRLSAIPKE
jgi:hypothetical protein